MTRCRMETAPKKLRQLRLNQPPMTSAEGVRPDGAEPARNGGAEPAVWSDDAADRFIKPTLVSSGQVLPIDVILVRAGEPLRNALAATH